ncbi:acid phosphatase [Schizopora paradoxa]|uniref:Acid phosphatase n=1 Tax=Schizopora paradoxa TaxID=27342 RepID=A0A0H2R347_9AGAM|nr:acid phosphatase [Schizopora paradoxa]
MRSHSPSCSVTKFLILLLAFVETSFGGQTTILHTNDDGWAVANIRAQDSALKAAGYDVVLVAPAENESGTGSSDAPASVVGSGGCEFDTCPAGAPATGFNASDPRFNYVNSFPVTTVRFGIQTVAPKFFRGARPDFVVSGPNVGTNLGSVTINSGTVGAACEAAKEGVPSVAFSAQTGSQISFTTLATPSNLTSAAEVYAALGVRLVTALIPPFDLFSIFEGPVLPRNITLNVNYPATNSVNCSSARDFRFVLTRVFAANDTTPPDVRTCGSDRLPTEDSVNAMPGCLATVSVMDAVTKADTTARNQQAVLDKLRGFLTCA